MGENLNFIDPNDWAGNLLKEISTNTEKLSVELEVLLSDMTKINELIKNKIKKGELDFMIKASIDLVEIKKRIAEIKKELGK